ncbi:MAG: hypothetical protein WD971_14390 [Pirellulales bacterium]
MIHEPIRGPRRRWTWTLVGLLQIGNAAAFGAAATTVDFSSSGESIVAADAAAVDPSTETEAPATATATTETAAVETATIETSPSSPAITGDSTDAIAEATMPTFAIGPISPLAEPVPWAPSPQHDTPAADEPEPVVSSSDVDTAASLSPVLVNVAENQLTVRFLVNGELIELGPGERRTLSGADTWVVRFDRGGDFGAATEILYRGTFRFVVSAAGWGLEPFDQTAADPSDGR